MDKLIDIDYIVNKDEAKLMNPQVLAFIGDSVYALYMKTFVVKHNIAKPNSLNSLTNELVNATKQSDVVNSLLDFFNDDEMSVYKRARNYKTNNVAKHASVIDYRRATGLEAVVGYLYLTNETKRMNSVLKICLGENNEN